MHDAPLPDTHAETSVHTQAYKHTHTHARSHSLSHPFVRASVSQDTRLHPASDQEHTRPRALRNPTSVMPGQERRKPTLGEAVGAARGRGGRGKGRRKERGWEREKERG